MVYVNKYQKYLNEIPKDIGECFSKNKMIAYGYTSNLDVLVNWDNSVFSQILDEYLKFQQPSFYMGETINSLDDFSRIVSYFVFNGIGGEVDITNNEVCNYLQSKFSNKLSLGGTCAQGCAALGRIGLPLVTHITDKSEVVCSFIEASSTFMVDKKKLIQIKNNKYQIPVRHFILQFPKDDVIKIKDKEYMIPLSNRLILDYDNLHKDLSIDRDFLNYIENNSSKFYSYSISGFNGIIDEKILNERINELKNHYLNVKNNNPNCIIYLECAHYLNSECRHLVLKGLDRCIDILGLNEEELIDIGKESIGVKINNDISSVINGLDAIINKYFLKGIVLHTKDYSMYYGYNFKKFNMEKGLTIGNLMAATKARISIYGSFEDLKDSLSLSISSVGISFAKELKLISVNKYACIVPSMYMENPKCTIGLGDTFTAGMQFSFIC